MKKYTSRILAAVGVTCALAAFFFMLFAPVAVSNGAYPGASFNGLDIIFGDISWESAIILSLQSGDYVALMTISGLDFSIVNFIPLFLIIVGVIVFGILAILDIEKTGRVCGIVATTCFLIASIIILLMCKFAVPTYEIKAVTEHIPSNVMQKFEAEGVSIFRQTLNLGFGWGAIVGSVLALLAFVSTAVGTVLNFLAYKKEKTLNAQ